MITRRDSLILLSASALGTALPGAALADAQLDREARDALQSLYRSNPTAKELGGRATAVLVFPEIVKAGLLIGGQTGTGVLLRSGKTAGRYRLAAASYGLQAGVQRYGYALFFMKEEGLRYLERSDGWEVGIGPSVVVVDQGFARSTSSTTLMEDVYAFVFDQSGLMAGMGLNGSKITRIDGD